MHSWRAQVLAGRAAGLAGERPGSPSLRSIDLKAETTYQGSAAMGNATDRRSRTDTALIWEANWDFRQDELGPSAGIITLSGLRAAGP